MGDKMAQLSIDSSDSLCTYMYTMYNLATCSTYAWSIWVVALCYDIFKKVGFYIYIISKLTCQQLFSLKTSSPGSYRNCSPS